jgi:hypothetical protein
VTADDTIVADLMKSQSRIGVSSTSQTESLGSSVDRQRVVRCALRESLAIPNFDFGFNAELRLPT